MTPEPPGAPPAQPPRRGARYRVLALALGALALVALYSLLDASGTVRAAEALSHSLGAESWTSVISTYGYWAVFVLSILEGPIVTIFAAFLASQGVFSVTAVYALVVLGDLVGDAAYYSIGRWLVRRLPWRMGPRASKLRQRVDALSSHIRAHAGRVLLVGKLTQSAGFAVLLAAGAARVPFLAFMFYNVVGTLVKSAALTAFGYFFGHFYGALDRHLQIIGAIGLAAFCLAMIPLLRPLLMARNLKGPE